MDIRLDDLPISLQMKILRTVAGVSAQTMAERWGKSQAYVYRVERGESDPTPLEIKDAHEAAKIASARAMQRALEQVASGAGSDPVDRETARARSGELGPDRGASASTPPPKSGRRRRP